MARKVGLVFAVCDLDVLATTKPHPIVFNLKGTLCMLSTLEALLSNDLFIFWNFGQLS